jgi:hypothetical protein
MPESGTTIRHHEVRIYDGTSPTQWSVELFQYNVPDMPLSEPRPGMETQLDRGRANDHVINIVDDEAIPFNPIEGSLNLAYMSENKHLYHAMGNPLHLPAWLVAGDTWVGVAQDAIGTRLNSAGSSAPAWYPPDSWDRTHMVQMVVSLTNPGDAPTGTPLFVSYKGVCFYNVMLVSEGNFSRITFDYRIHGEINPRLTAWPTGNISEP